MLPKIPLTTNSVEYASGWFADLLGHNEHLSTASLVCAAMTVLADRAPHHLARCRILTRHKYQVEPFSTADNYVILDHLLSLYDKHKIVKTENNPAVPVCHHIVEMVEWAVDRKVPLLPFKRGYEFEDEWMVKVTSICLDFMLAFILCVLLYVCVMLCLVDVIHRHQRDAVAAYERVAVAEICCCMDQS